MSCAIAGDIKSDGVVVEASPAGHFDGTKVVLRVVETHIVDVIVKGGHVTVTKVGEERLQGVSQWPSRLRIRVRTCREG